MEQILRISLYLHILSGFTALLAGLSAIVSVKGGRLHKISGTSFFYAMLGVTISALIISAVKQNYFLLSIGIFSSYMNYTGYRAVKGKMQKVHAADWVILCVAVVTTVLMLQSFNLILVVYGCLNGFFVVSDIILYARISKGAVLHRKTWLVRHIGRMMGAYIATLTAFIVVNVSNVQPAWLLWLLPTIIGVPVIYFYVRKTVSPAL